MLEVHVISIYASVPATYGYLFFTSHAVFYLFISTEAADFSKSVSGSYRSQVNSDGYWMELRVDIDQVRQFSEVLNMLSGDIFEGDRFKASFMCEKIDMEEQNQVKVLLGEACFPTAKDQGSMKCQVTISRDNTTFTANVTLTQEGQKNSLLLDKMHFRCVRQSSFFRTLHVEIDYDNENFHDHLPTFNSGWHTGLKKKYGERRLDLFGLYRDAGVNLIWDKELSNLVEDPDPSTPWEWSEMMSVMEKERGDVHSEESRIMFEDGRNDWSIWLLLGGKFASREMLGVMFDLGKGQTTRNGTTVFVDSHRDLPSWEHFDQPHTTKEAVALWNYLFTLVHEVGHTFNLPHTFFPSKYFKYIAHPEALSFMNYPDQYKDGAKEGLKDFFTEFLFTFTKEELVFIRHMSYDVVRPGMGEGHTPTQESHSRPALMRHPSVAEHILDLSSG